MAAVAVSGIVREADDSAIRAGEILATNSLTNLLGVVWSKEEEEDSSGKQAGIGVSNGAVSLETLAAAAAAILIENGVDTLSKSEESKFGRTGNITFDGTTVLCQVCGDKASGFHYGVHACEGCKGFFRRSIQQKIQYRPCTKNQQCSVLRINRNRCQYCRLKKCIAVGMSRDAVRFGRVPKREKAKILAEMQRANAQSQVNLISAELENEERWISDIITAHMETCEFTHEKFLPLLQRYRQMGLPRPSSNVACPLNPLPVNGNGCQEELSEKYSPAIRGVVNFAKCIPGFNVLPQEDQVTLLKAGVFEVLLLRLTILFDTDSKSLLVLNGSIYRRDACMSTASSSGGGSSHGHNVCQGRFLVDSLFDFVDRFHNLGLNDADIAMFCSVVLISPDRPGLRNPELVEKIHDRLKQALRNVLQVHHPGEPSLFGQLMLKVPDLRTLNTLHSEKLLAFKLEPQEKFRFGKESVESSANGSYGSGESSSSAASSRSLRSPLSDVSSCDAGSTKNQKAKGFSGEGSQWSTMCRASESKDGNSSNVSFTSPIPASSRALEPPHIQALNLCSSSTYGTEGEKQPQQQQQLVRVINWRTSKECPSLDSGKGSASSGGESLSDHAHSDTECRSQRPAAVLEDGTKLEKSKDGNESKRSADMPTLKRALLAPPLAMHSDLPNQASGSVRDKHMYVASLLEKQSLGNGPPVGNLLIPADSLPARFGQTGAGGVFAGQQHAMNWGLGTASNALAAHAFLLNNRSAPAAGASQQRSTPQQLVQHQQTSASPIQQLLNAAAATAAVNNVTKISTPVLQSPLNYPPMKTVVSPGEIVQPMLDLIGKRNHAQNGSEEWDFAVPTSIRTSVLTQNDGGGARSSPKRTLLDAALSSADDDDQPLNLSKKQAVSNNTNSEQTGLAGRPPFNVHSVSGLSCR